MIKLIAVSYLRIYNVLIWGPGLSLMAMWLYETGMLYEVE